MIYVCVYIFKKDKYIIVYKRLTHVSHAPLPGPKARRQAGSSAWKNSSGWKKVARYRALSSRRMTMSRSGTGERRGLLLNEAEGARWWPAMVQCVDGFKWRSMVVQLSWRAIAVLVVVGEPL